MPPRQPKLDPFTGIIDRILEDDQTSHRKQRHTAKRIFDRLRDEYGFTGGYTIVKDYVREPRLWSRESWSSGWWATATNPKPARHGTQERTLEVVPGYNGSPIWSTNRAARLFALDVEPQQVVPV